MNSARETIELLGQIARTLSFEGTKHGLRDREWMVLRFLANANKPSRTPSAVAGYIGATRGTASHIINELERLGHLDRTRSADDKRSVMLSLTQQGEKFLARDPINVLVDSINALDGGTKAGLTDALRHVLDQLDIAQQRRHADICKRCIFLRENPADTAGKTSAKFTCRFFRTSITEAEAELLCTNFEPRRQ
jgi:DNA-binding MarR family transcriptional regulator